MVWVPEDGVEMPEWRPDLFRKPEAAWPVGQCDDFVVSFCDGSRLHVQRFVDRGLRWLRFHRDRWDPACGPGHTLAHLTFETPLGPVAGLGVLLWLVSRRGRF
jgi:hypothetical protein